jgi:glycosidase
MNHPEMAPFQFSKQRAENDMVSEPDPGVDRASAWWQSGVIYQIYPRSFQDSNGDGIGDLNGIASRLEHLVELGIDAVWLSPIFTSPMADFGYDVADYCGIDPIFGTLEDFDRLLAAVHRKGLKLILDFVPNHTSDLHPWFVESRRSVSSPKRDWYIWRDPKPDGGPPNNWVSEFGGPAWTFDQASGQYYYHAYLSQQPDLNWRNPAVRDVMLDVLRFWLQRGVDGFRVDAIHHLFEDAQLRDNPVNPEWRAGMSPARRLIRLRTMDQPEVHDAISQMRQVADQFGDRLTLRGTPTIYQGEELGCPGPVTGTAGSPPRRHGCRSIPRERPAANSSATTAPRCFRSINPCCDYAATSRPSPSVPIGAWHTPTTSWSTSASTPAGNSTWL